MMRTTPSKVDATIRAVITALFLLGHLAFLDDSIVAGAAEPSHLRVLCYNIHYGRAPMGNTICSASLT